MLQPIDLKKIKVGTFEYKKVLKQKKDNRTESYGYIVLVNAVTYCPSIKPLASLPMWHLRKSQQQERPRRVVLFCPWEPSCAMLLCPGPEPSPIVCCHMEVSSNTEISLSSCCSLTFSGTQLALNGKIYNYPRYPCWLCLVIVCWGLKEGPCLVQGGGVFFLF